MRDPLKTYKAKRNFNITPEPAEGGKEGGEQRAFVIQKHWASRLHYDFRLELEGAMKSWAVPKGPSYDPHDKRMAVQVEDHPIAYNEFEGTIPEHQYGAGKVIIWDRGTWQPDGNPHQGYRDGNLKFTLHGHKMQGRWALVRMKDRGEKQPAWLLIKEKDDYAKPADEFSVVDEMPDSVKALGMPGAPPAKGARVKSAGAAGKARRAAAKPAVEAAPEAAALPKARLPATLAPPLATLVDGPPPDPDNWLFEIKFDGYRILARIDGKGIQLITRNGNDWTGKLEPLRAALEKMQLPKGWYDGEIVVHDQNGRPDFGLLQQAFDEARNGSIVYFVFDAPYLDGHDLRGVPLAQRRELLYAVLKDRPSDTVRYSAELDAPPADMVAAACKMGLEGIIGKRRDSTYVSRRTPDWIKLKCGQRQEFVIGGYTDPKGSRQGIGSLLLGVQDKDGALHYAGNVGSGFKAENLQVLRAQLDKLATGSSPFAPGRKIGKKAHWVRPQLVAEVSFGEWTRDGSIRHAVFQGLRADKPPRAITREQPAHVEDLAHDAAPARKRGKADAPALQGNLPEDVKVTNPDRVIDKASGAHKIDVVRYYALVGSLMMEHLQDRPVALVRAPAGVGGELFFQKHADVTKMPGLKLLNPKLDPGHPAMLAVGDQQGLLWAAQWNVLEIHTQNATARSYEKPNRMVFDLDPGEGVAWAQMQEAAQLVHAFLDELGLPAFLKTSGGKGLHVVVPVKPHYGWDAVKAFSQAIVDRIAHTLPDRFAFKSGPQNRVGKIFVDYLRNGRGATTACAWSVRARPGLGISVPVAWDELDTLKGGAQWTVHNAHTRLDVGNGPWADYADSAVGLAAAMKKLGFEP
ncbi:DNA ligase D [Pseudoduganella ginsengisoli]|uniref:DNA ligase (ATP) n=1 Tax=Pseudoduganella ginsengisoli TaxID=1462440 RepID=A0A6L6Q3V9_9BURK|nr:DNA ligase D [Pseudoduganella ginsengisoli]MTW03898.1 DNA ligase D [Pseudoduganella ginsengisoli]